MWVIDKVRHMEYVTLLFFPVPEFCKINVKIVDQTSIHNLSVIRAVLFNWTH